MILSKEIKELIAMWRPVLGNNEDIMIKKLIEKPSSGSYRNDNLRKLKYLLNKRICPKKS